MRRGGEDEREKKKKKGMGDVGRQGKTQRGSQDRREKGHWEIERDIRVRVRVLAWQKRDSWPERDPDKDRK